MPMHPWNPTREPCLYFRPYLAVPVTRPTPAGPAALGRGIVMAAFALATAIAGFASLALSTQRHHRELFGTPPARRRVVALRVAGWMLLCVSLAACIKGPGWPVGSVLWFGMLTVAALPVILILTYSRRRRHRRPNALTHRIRN